MIGLVRRIKDRLAGKAPAGARRSPAWPRVRAAHLALRSSCASCGGQTALEVHHIVPFHKDPGRELDPANLITLCESGKGGVNCHLFFGHLGDYKAVNPTVAVDTLQWRMKSLHARIERLIDYSGDTDGSEASDRGDNRGAGAGTEESAASSEPSQADCESGEAPCEVP